MQYNYTLLLFLVLELQRRWLRGYLLLGLLILHILGALKHQFIDRHSELVRMGIGCGRPP